LSGNIKVINTRIGSPFFLFLNNDNWWRTFSLKTCIHIGRIGKMSISRGDGWDSINRFSPPFVVPVLNHDRDIQRHTPCFFCILWVQLRWELIVRFVDIGGIDDHHCLNFLFIRKNTNHRSSMAIPTVERFILIFGA
jgi:hypothetical protein